MIGRPFGADDEWKPWPKRPSFHLSRMLVRVAAAGPNLMPSAALTSSPTRWLHLPRWPNGRPTGYLLLKYCIVGSTEYRADSTLYFGLGRTCPCGCSCTPVSAEYSICPHVGSSLSRKVRMRYSVHDLDRDATTTSEVNRQWGSGGQGHRPIEGLSRPCPPHEPWPQPTVFLTSGSDRLHPFPAEPCSSPACEPSFLPLSLLAPAAPPCTLCPSPFPCGPLVC